MSAMMILRTMVVVVACFSSGGVTLANEQLRYAPASVQGSVGSQRSADMHKVARRPSGLKQGATRALSANRDPYADPAAPYKADRLSSPQAGPILNIPGQTTVLTRQVLDDMNATSVKDALRSTAGVTVGR
jgi:outer membrane receptor for monomeric catechols